jgi:hypothetical protein
VRQKCEAVLAKAREEHEANLWEKFQWFLPLWVSMEKIRGLLKEAAHRKREDAAKLFDHHMSTVYTLAFQAVCIAQILPHARGLAEFAPLARAAYLAFYSGHRASSIAALIPVMKVPLDVWSSTLRVYRLGSKSIGLSTERLPAPPDGTSMERGKFRVL